MNITLLCNIILYFTIFHYILLFDFILLFLILIKKNFGKKGATVKRPTSCCSVPFRFICNTPH